MTDGTRDPATPPSRRAGLLERTFRLAEHGTSVRTEVLAGLTTFLTMAYIVFVNPSILAEAGMPRGAVFVATCLVAALGSLIMGLYANYPIALAPGMGLNAYFTYVIVQGLGFTWQAALGAVFISGLCFLAVTLTGLRALIVDGIPRSMRIAITVGIGLFLAIIALKNAGVVAASPATFVTLGDLHKPETVLAVIGFLIVAVLSARKVRAALLTSILTVTALSFVFAGNTFQGVVALPPSLAPTFLALDVSGALSAGLMNVILVLFLVELFDATGTLMGVASRAGLLTDDRLPRLNRALMADSAAVFAGSLLGTSSTTAYLESASGVEQGGRTGLTAATVAALFVACLFFAPLAAAVPAYATAPALFYVACLMLRELVALDWDDLTEAIPACVTALLMPFTYSIATGVSLGFIIYAVLKLLTGRAREVKPVVWVIAVVFLYKLVETGGAH
ncbi:NCS2 family permease [Methylobacterium mesophilicum SR1.6/6]|uniref:NCS2 family permease n=1 Tax=Methylobacterium mesophilicum SR1.6/6 TaxID=908290 RepID=A0A6B9FIT7_9HYPH|nr:NCS2 family permease [Methylobacterium mesophilicum]QGY01676.1 NCS2 family permease [Methylobacterium mesophilicum SR1.6/6]